ncbi:MAG: DHHA1 domain-containing protein, partial [Planctomycetota bacterium]
EQLSGLPPTRSSFYEPGDAGCRAATRVVRLFKAPASGAKDALVLEASPFYAESGGQVGDAGLIRSADGRFEFSVEDTKKLGEIIVHVGNARGEIAAETQVVAEVDAGRRAATRANHTATHLLHKALKEVLGEHVGQQGSYVGPDRLRFDFSNPQAVSPEQLERIEQHVNREIARNASVDTTVEDLEAAKSRGVVAMFGEKYADRVRVVSVGGYSAELCGGTHVRAAGDIGTFLIVQERALSAGVRRIEAVTRENALLRAQELRRQLQGAARLLKTAPEELGSRIEQLQQQLKDARKKEAAGAGVDVGSALELVRGALAVRRGISAAVLDLPDLDGEGLRSLGERVKTLAPDLALALFARSDGKVPFLVVCEGKALALGLHAGQTATAIAKLLGGGGGGRPNTAQGQGLNPAALGEATALAGRWLDEKLGD